MKMHVANDLIHSMDCLENVRFQIYKTMYDLRCTKEENQTGIRAIDFLLWL